ncbi:MAG TPA: hypothetical protein VGV57_08415 [Thermoleophilaceae bacterium]|nr:hypothetical protein [Thermoleophilaceae bacterium]
MRGGSRLSRHGEGRAVDWYRNANDPTQAAEAQRIIDWLLGPDAQGNQHALARRMGIEEVIWNRRIWTARRHAEGWRPYGGVNPHTDHLHIGMNWPGARMETSWWRARQAPTTSVAPATVDRAAQALGKDAAPSATRSMTKRFQRMLDSGLTKGDAEFSELNKFVLNLMKPADLRACLDMYLDRFSKYPTGSRTRSDMIFRVLLSKGLKLSEWYSRDDFPERLADALNAKSPPLAPVRVRLDLLEAAHREEVKGELARTRRNRLEDRRLLDPITNAYINARRHYPYTVSELLEFDPSTALPNPAALRAEHHHLRKECILAQEASVAKFNEDTYKRFDSAHTAYREFLKARTPLELFAVLFWQRRGVESGRPRIYLDAELYLHVVVAIQGHARRVRNIVRQPDGGDLDFFFRALNGNYYRSNMHAAFALSLKNLDEFHAFTSVSRYMSFFARSRGMTLLPLDRLLEVAKSRRTLPCKQLQEMRDPNNPRIRLGAKIATGNPIGGDCEVVWLDGSVAFIAFEKFHAEVPLEAATRALCPPFARVPMLLFEASPARLRRWQADEVYVLVYEKTKHLETLIPAFWNALLYVPDLVSGGLVGLARSIVADELIGLAIDALSSKAATSQPPSRGLAVGEHGTRALGRKVVSVPKKSPASPVIPYSPTAQRTLPTAITGVVAPGRSLPFPPTDKLQSAAGELTDEGIAWIRAHVDDIRDPRKPRVRGKAPRLPIKDVPVKELPDSVLRHVYANSHELVEMVVLAELHMKWAKVPVLPTDFLFAKGGNMNALAKRLAPAAKAAGAPFDSSVLGENTMAYIHQRVNGLPLRPDLADELARLHARGADVRKRLDELGNGTLGAKQPDAVEVMLSNKEVHVWDATLAIDDPVHRFKTRLYAHMLSDLFMGSNVRVTAADVRALGITRRSDARILAHEPHLGHPRGRRPDSSVAGARLRLSGAQATAGR